MIISAALYALWYLGTCLLDFTHSECTVSFTTTATWTTEWIVLVLVSVRLSVTGLAANKLFNLANTLIGIEGFYSVNSDVTIILIVLKSA